MVINISNYFNTVAVSLKS